ncbi:hypothetical protein ACIQC5_01145 [Paenarthrobacter sp. NPDC092416]|uniref:hypothetical protein n=1 Tax=Paenarthrobacter sp. NPDC092416 TaxID=3364386 RepID=UPI00381449FD
MSSQRATYNDLEPLAKGLTVAFFTALQVPPQVTTGAWDSARAITRSSKARRANSNEPVVKLVERALRTWAERERMSESALNYGLQAATDAVGSHGLAFEEIANLRFDHNAVVERVQALNAESISASTPTDAERSAYERVLSEFYAIVIDSAASGVKGLDTPAVLAALNAAVRAASAAEDARDSLKLIESNSRVLQSELDVRLRSAADVATAYEIDSRTNRLGNRSQLITTPVLAAADATLQFDWRAHVEERLNTVRAACAGRPSFLNLDEDLVKLDLNGAYETIRSRIARLGLSELIIALRDSTVANHHNPSIGEPFPAAQRAVAWLEAQCRNPSYQWFVPLLGAWGSGKTRTVYEIARQAQGRGEHVVYLVPDGTRSLMEQLLQKVAVEWDRPIASVADLGRILAGLHSRLTVVLDDFEEWIRIRSTAVAELIELLARNTATPYMRWVVTMDSSRLDLVMGSVHRDFWRQYGISSHRETDSTVDGWWNLDATNVRHRLGLNLLRIQSSDMDDKVLGRVEEEAAGFKFAGRFFCDPLPAWLHIESRERGIGEFNNLTAMEKYWGEKREGLKSQGHRASDLDRTVAAIAQLLSEDTNRSISLRSVFDLLTTDTTSGPRLSEREIDDTVNLLKSAGLLAIDSDAETVSPRVEIFWAYKIAEILTRVLLREEATSETAIVRLQPWQRRSDKADWLAESVVQFVLQMLRSRESTALGRDVWEGWLSKGWLSNLPLWSAAINSTPQTQADLARCIKRFPIRPATPHELYIYLRFLALTSDSAMTGLDRIAAIQPHFQAIGKAGLGSYLVHVVRRSLSLIELSSGSELSKLLNHLVGVEKSGSMEEVVRLVVDSGQEAYSRDPDRWLLLIGAFLGKGNESNGNTHPVPKQLFGNEGNSEFFWQCLVQTVVDSLIRDRELSAFEDLNAARWLKDDKDMRMSRHVAREVRHAVNTTMGSLFRRGNRTTPTEFVGLLSKLSVGNACEASESSQSERALFILRHTVPTGSKTALKINAILHPILLDLARNRELMRKHRSIILPMLAANGLSRKAE